MTLEILHCGAIDFVQCSALTVSEKNNINRVNQLIKFEEEGSLWKREQMNQKVNTKVKVVSDTQQTKVKGTENRKKKKLLNRAGESLN